MRIRDDVAYILPIGVFLVLTQVGVSWASLYPASYVAKTALVPVLLVWLWKYFTKIRWTHLWLGGVVGVVGVVQWVGMEKLLLAYGPGWTHIGGDSPFNPMEYFSSGAALWGFVAIRFIDAVLVVPVMEELFWRDFLWRTIAAPNNFKLAQVGEWDPRSVLIVTALFCSVHVQWLTAIVWGLMIALLLLRTRSLGACIVAHAVTNLLLGVYVLWTHDWYFW